MRYIEPKQRIREILAHPELGKSIILHGWIRTRRDSKTGFSFLEINDGSSLAGMQVVAESSLPNYESEIKRLVTGCSVRIEGILRESPGKEQAVETQATHIDVIGWVDDPDTYPLQKKRHTMEYMREVAHLRPRSNTFGAIARVRNHLAAATHDFFQSRGFLYIHTPIITASDCEGAGEMFTVTTLDPADLPRLPDGSVDYAKDFFVVN